LGRLLEHVAGLPAAGLFEGGGGAATAPKVSKGGGGEEERVAGHADRKVEVE
jgi:hypothetical protein